MGAVRLLHQCIGHRISRVRQERQQLGDRGNGLRATLARDRREQRYRRVRATKFAQLRQSSAHRTERPRTLAHAMVQPQ
jgi:hypothetical protein